jgi:hypothetical protein
LNIIPDLEYATLYLTSDDCPPTTDRGYISNGQVKK